MWNIHLDFSDNQNKIDCRLYPHFSAKQLDANLPAAWKNNYHYFIRWVEGDYSLGTKSIPSLVMINLPSVWLPVWPGNTPAAAGPSGWWPPSSLCGQRPSLHVPFQCPCTLDSAPSEPRLCLSPHGSISPTAHFCHRLLGLCRPALRPAPCYRKERRMSMTNHHFNSPFFPLKFLPVGVPRALHSPRVSLMTCSSVWPLPTPDRSEVGPLLWSPGPARSWSGGTHWSQSPARAWISRRLWMLSAAGSSAASSLTVNAPSLAAAPCSGLQP